MTANVTTGPQEAFVILQNVYDTGRVQYLSGMIKHASVCEHKYGHAFICIGKSGKKEFQREPYYVISRQDDDEGLVPWRKYSYKDNLKKTPKAISSSFTAPVSLDALLAWCLNGGATHACGSSRCPRFINI